MKKRNNIFNFIFIITFIAIITLISIPFVSDKIIHSALSSSWVENYYIALSTLFNGIAFLAIILSIRLQSTELEYQIIELRESVKAQKEASESLSKQTKLQFQGQELATYTALLDHHTRLFDSYRDNPSLADLELTQYHENKMNECSRHIYELLIKFQ